MRPSTLVRILLVLVALAWAERVAYGDAGSLSGQFLVASPDMSDPRFARTVVLVVRHDAAGAFGLVINRVAAIRPLTQTMRDLGLEPTSRATGEASIHYGGPLDLDRPFLLHSADYLGPYSVTVGPDLAFTPDLSLLTRHVDGGAPAQVSILFGHAGWAPGQLDREVRAGAWSVVPADAATVFDNRQDRTWERALSRHRIDL